MVFSLNSRNAVRRLHPLFQGANSKWWMKEGMAVEVDYFALLCRIVLTISQCDVIRSRFLTREIS